MRASPICGLDDTARPRARQLRTATLLRGIYRGAEARDPACPSPLCRLRRTLGEVRDGRAGGRRERHAPLIPRRPRVSARSAARTAGITSVPSRRTLSRAAACGRPDQEVLKITPSMPVSRCRCRILLHDLFRRAEIHAAVAHELVGQPLLQRSFLLRRQRLPGIEVHARSAPVGEVERSPSSARRRCAPPPPRCRPRTCRA